MSVGFVLLEEEPCSPLVSVTASAEILLMGVVAMCEYPKHHVEL